MLYNITRTFFLGHLFLTFVVFMTYIRMDNKPALWILCSLMLAWTLLLLRFTLTQQLKKWLRRRRNLWMLMLADSLFITCVYFLPGYDNSSADPKWVILILVPFYASEFGSKAAMQLCGLGVANLLLANLLLQTDYSSTMYVILAFIIFILFIGVKTDKLHRLAYFDSLTGLSNRTYMRNALDFYAAAANPGKSERFCLYLIDLDQFKEVNDRLGHEAGDRLLKSVAERMQKIVPDTAILARMGGDEFTVLLPVQGDNQQAKQLSRRLIECLDQPVRIKGMEVTISMSVGVSLFPDHGETGETLMKKADIAMYAAKKAGRNRCVFYSEV